MHVCDEFREKITEQLLDREDLQANAGVQRELLLCNSCADFYSESREMVEALSSVDLAIGEYHWDAMANRLHERIVEDHARRQQSGWRTWFRIYTPALAGAAAMVLVIVGLLRVGNQPVQPALQSAVQPTAVVIGNPSLDPVTAEYLEQSELLLRSVMKLQASSIDDVKEAKETANRQLIGLDQRREAAAGITPVVNVMDKYETILRDIRHLNQHSMAADIEDIQNRIEKNGLIADMKAVQPKLTTADTDLGRDQQE